MAKAQRFALEATYTPIAKLLLTLSIIKQSPDFVSELLSSWFDFWWLILHQADDVGRQPHDEQTSNDNDWRNFLLQSPHAEQGKQ